MRFLYLMITTLKFWLHWKRNYPRRNPGAKRHFQKAGMAFNAICKMENISKWQLLKECRWDTGQYLMFRYARDLRKRVSGSYY